MGKFASGSKAIAISDRSGMQFPYTEMVKEWNGMWVHYSEFEIKQPQLDLAVIGPDGIALDNNCSFDKSVFLSMEKFTN